MDAPFDAMASADFLVADRDRAVEAVQRALGFAQPKPHWSHGGPGSGYRVTFCRPNPVLAESPTLVELIEPDSLDATRPLGAVVPNVAGLDERQGTRPVKTHGMPIASRNLDELVEHVRGLGLRHWVQPQTDGYPYVKLWMGITDDGLADYRPDGDGGLMVEVVHTDTLRLPPEAYDAPARPTDADPAAMLRTAARVLLTDDLDRSLATLASTFGWEPERGPDQAEDGSLRATLGFRSPRSARVELLQPAGGLEAEVLRRHGPGVWAVRVAVTDLHAKAEDLQRRGTPYAEVRTGFADPDRVLRIDPAATPGCLFEFVRG